MFAALCCTTWPWVALRYFASTVHPVEDGAGADRVELLGHQHDRSTAARIGALAYERQQSSLRLTEAATMIIVQPPQ